MSSLSGYEGDSGGYKNQHSEKAPLIIFLRSSGSPKVPQHLNALNDNPHENAAANQSRSDLRRIYRLDRNNSAEGIVRIKTGWFLRQSR